MKPEEFTSFDDEMPEDGKWVIVTNNINAKYANGEMSHAWLANVIMVSSKESGYLILDDADREVSNLTHWKYA